MWTKLLAGAYFALLISFVASYEEEESSTERMKKVQKYRIVKVYGRKLKTTTTTTTTPPPFKVIQPVTTWWLKKNETSSSEEAHQRPRDMLREESTSENTVNLGQMDLDNFDIGKLLAAAGHRGGGDPLAPTVVRFSAPSSDSHLDPAYLSKFIREQLGNDAQFQILPPSGKNDGDSFNPLFRPPPPLASGKQSVAKQQQFFGGFKHAPPSVAPTHQETLPVPTGKVNTYHAQRANTHYDGRRSKEIKPGAVSNGFQNQIQVPPPPPQGNRHWTTHFQPTTLHYNQGNQNYQSTPNPKSHQPPPLPPNQGPSGNFPLYPRNPAQSQKQSELINYGGLQKAQPTPIAPAPAQSTIPGKFPTYNKPLPSASKESLLEFKSEISAYSTLSQQLTAPGLNPGITGQYGTQHHHHHHHQQQQQQQQQKLKLSKENEVTGGHQSPSSREPKYSTTFIRGFNDDDRAQPQTTKHPQIPSTSSSPYSGQREGSQWRTSKEVGSFLHGSIAGQGSNPKLPQPPSVTFSLPRESSELEHQSLPRPSTSKPHREGDDKVRSQRMPGFDASEFSQHHHQPSRSPSENYPSYAKSIGWDDNEAEIDYGFTTPTPQPQYDPPPRPEYEQTRTVHGHSNIDYSPTTAHYGQPPTAQYGPPPPQALAQYQPSGYDHHHLGAPHQEPERVTKTIYVNLPPESPTTPKPYHHQRQVVLPQKHYKIVFVKAPTAPPPEEPEIEVTPSPETKTIIYVLHKKPEPAKKIVIKAPPPTTPPAPEVFFIQYKDKKGEEERHHEDIKWEDPIGNQGWESDRSPPPQQGYSPGAVDTTNGWLPIYNDNESRDYPDSKYHMSGSALVPVRVSVKKTVTTKI